LLISCKGRVHDVALEIGDYAATRNIRTVAQESVKHLDRIVAQLRANPKGDNLDFSAYPTVVGVVCFPFPVFLRDEELRQRVSAPDLRTLVSINELESWLNVSHQS